jgi:hypothetical protein
MKLINSKIIALILSQILGSIIISMSWLNAVDRRHAFGNLLAISAWSFLNMSTLFDYAKGDKN